MKNIRKQAPSWATHYDAKTDTYNDKGDGFSLARLSAKAEFLICLALIISTVIAHNLLSGVISLNYA